MGACEATGHVLWGGVGGALNQAGGRGRGRWGRGRRGHWAGGANNFLRGEARASGMKTSVFLSTGCVPQSTDERSLPTSAGGRGSQRKNTSLGTTDADGRSKLQLCVARLLAIGAGQKGRKGKKGRQKGSIQISRKDEKTLSSVQVRDDRQSPAEPDRATKI